MLCANGARGGHDLPGAIFAYNHDTAYVHQVLHIAATYAAHNQPTTDDSTFDAPTRQAAIAIAYARAQLGRPYVWGGDGPSRGDAGFDCSGLTQAAYAAAGIHLPRRIPCPRPCTAVARRSPLLRHAHPRPPRRPVRRRRSHDRRAPPWGARPRRFRQICE
jgi:hypothetical protein